MPESRAVSALGWLCAGVFALAACAATAQDPPPDETQAPAENETPAESDAQPPTDPAAQPSSDDAGLDIIPVDTAAPPAAPAADSDTVELEEVKVTAQRRVESLQKTPVSVSAFNMQKLEARGIDNILDLGSHVPGMQIEPFPINISTLRIFIRGIGALDAQVTQDPSVGVYLDGVYLGRSAGLAFDVADLERIEVLRGPQGTLYGRNTVGGAINLITRRPSTNGFEMTHKFIAGNRDYGSARTMVNIPILDNLAAKFVGMSSHKKGYVENIGPGGDFGDRDDVAARGDVRWEATDWLTADYAYDYTDIEHYQYMYQAVFTPETHHGQAESFKRYGQSQTLYSEDRLDQMSSGRFMEPSRVRIQGHSFNLAAMFGDVEVKYTGSMRKLMDKAYADLSGGLDVSGGDGNTEYRLDPGPYDGPATMRPEIGHPIQLAWLRNFQEQTSHELQALGSFWDDRVRYIIGAFQFDETGFDDRCGSAGDECEDPITHQFHTRLQEDVPTRVTNIVLNYRSDIENSSMAYFTQATWTPQILSEKLHVTLGYRHTTDERAALKNYRSRIYAEDMVARTSQDITAAAGTCQDPNVSTGENGNDDFVDVAVGRTFENDSFSGILAYDLTPDINTYAKYVQAYKSGGFDTRDPQIDGTRQASDCTTYNLGFVTGFAPEYVDSIEAGFKSEWFSRSLRLNLNLFHMDYTDRQISALLQGAIQDTKTRNVGKSRIMGAEFEGMWAVRRGLIASLDFEYLDAETIEVLDFEGNNVADRYQPYSAPHKTWSSSIDWTIAELGFANLSTYINYNYVDRRSGQTLPNRVGLTALGQYGVLNGRLGLDSIGFFGRGRLDTAVWIRNALDEEYELSAIDNLPQADRSVIWAEPRTFGADLIYRWN